jgi:P27 family predicted phage terminase small subunit
MTLRGRPPKPTALKVLEGNPGKRPLNEREPKPLTVEPDMPSYLDREAQREWKRLVPILLRMRVLTEADGVALANLCQAYSTMVQAQKLMSNAAKGRRSPLLVKTRAGYQYQSPLLGIINGQMEIIARHLREFGLTPASRSRVVTNTDARAGDSLEVKLCG